MDDGTGTKSKSRPKANPPPWTATRCHRLLRPLLVPIASLRKERFPARAANERTRPGPGKRADRDGASSGRDKKRRKIVRYSSRASRSRASPEAPEEPFTPQTPQPPPQQRIVANRPAHPISLTTPFLRRVRNHDMSSPQQAPELDDPLPAGRAQVEYSKDLALLRDMGTVTPERLRLQESVLHALDVLLAATCPRKTAVAEPRSLMAMCLRKVPECIADLERWEQKEARENGTKSTMSDSQISMEVYSDLESLGATEGWRHLCLVVRTHGMLIVRKAVREGLFDDSVMGLILKVCLVYLPPPEFEELVDAFIIRQYPDPRSDSDNIHLSVALSPLTILKNFDDSFRLKKLGELLASGMLPNKWALTDDFKTIYAEGLNLLAKRNVSVDVNSFMAIALEQYCFLESAERQEQRQRQRQASEGDPYMPRQFPYSGTTKRCLVFVVGTLATLPLLAQERETPTDAAREKTAIISERVRLILLMSITNIGKQQTGPKATVSSYALSLCAFLALDDEVAASAIQAAWRRRDRRAENPAFLYDVTTEIIGAIAYHLDRSAPVRTNHHHRQLCDKLGSLDLPCDQGSILSHSAFIKAGLSGTLPDLAYAESLQTRNKASKTSKESNGGPKALYPGYTWDDDMGEWVDTNGRKARKADPDFLRPPRSQRPRLPPIPPPLPPPWLLLASTAPAAAAAADPDDDSLSDDASETSGVSDNNSGEASDEEPAAGPSRTTEPTPRSSPALPPPGRPATGPRRVRFRTPNSPPASSDGDYVPEPPSSNASLPGPRPPPKQPHGPIYPTRGRPSRLPPPVEYSSSDSDDDDELGQEDKGSGSMPLRTGRAAAVRTLGAVRRSGSLMSLVGSDSSGDELSLA